MSKKNINESLKDAWQKSLQNGETIRSIKQKEKAQLDSIVEETRNDVLSHIAESDKGFYRPETSPYHKFRDGEYIRRQRLLEQEAIPGSTSTDAGLSQDVDEERRKRERERRQREQEQQGRRREEVADQAASTGPTRATDPRRTGTRGSTGKIGFDPSQRNPDDVRNPGRDQAIDNIIASTKDETPIVVPDSLARPEDQSPRDPLADTMIGKPEEKTPGEFVLRPDEKKPEEVETVGAYRRNQLNKMSDEELAAEVDTQAGKDFKSKMAAIEAEEAEKEGISVEELRARTKQRQAKLKDYDRGAVTSVKYGASKEARRKIEDLEAQAKAARRAGDKEESIKLYRQASQLRRDIAADRSEYARSGEDVPAAAGDDKDAASKIGAGGGGDGEDNPATEVTSGPVSTDTLQHGGVVEPKDEPEYSVDQAGKPTGETVIDDEGNVRDVIVGPQTQMADAPGKPGSGYNISGALSTEIDLDKFGMPDNPDIQLKGVVTSRIRKDGAGYKVLNVDSEDPSGVEYIRNYQDGRKEIRYRTGRVTTLDAQGNEIQAGEEGAAPELSNLQSRKIDAEIAGNEDLQRMKADMNKYLSAAGRGGAGPTSSIRDFSGSSRRRASELRSKINKAVQELARRMGVSADAVKARFEAELGLPAKTEAEKQAAATQTGDDVKPDPVTGVNAPTNAPPASVADQPPASPPPPAPAAEEEEEELVGPPQPVTSSYNHINKYGVNLFEAKGPLQR